MSRRSVLITGGSSGIGLACALAMHSEGWDVGLVGRRENSLAAAAATVAATTIATTTIATTTIATTTVATTTIASSDDADPDGANSDAAQVATFVADLADAESPAAVVEQHVRRFGGIDALVAGAGNYDLDDVRTITAQRWDATIDLHLRGAVLGAGAAARHMSGAGRGRIVLLSSVNGFHSEPASVAYSAAKSAIISVARSLAVDLAGSGVQANAIAPGWVTTPMTEAHLARTTGEQLHRVNPMGRAGTAAEIANLVRYLIIDAPDFLTGATIAIDGGQTAVAPMP